MVILMIEKLPPEHITYTFQADGLLKREVHETGQTMYCFGGMGLHKGVWSQLGNAAAVLAAHGLPYMYSAHDLFPDMHERHARYRAKRLAELLPTEVARVVVTRPHNLARYALREGREGLISVVVENNNSTAK